MILSVSRRTDVPNYYSDWFIRRIQEGFLYVRNPMNARQVSRIDLSPEVVDCIVFWTKNPANMLDKLDCLQDHAYYFQFTLTGYGRDIEPNLPDKRSELIPAFQRLSRKIGRDRVIWRYDPIFINSRYTMEYHIKAFEEIAESLTGHTERAVISFLDLYAKIQRNAAASDMKEMTYGEISDISKELIRIASRYGMAVETCAEKWDLQDIGIRHGSCIDKKLIERITGYKLTGGRDKNQRAECGCFESIDIGTYNTCPNGCKYCYANFSDERVRENIKLYNADSELLCGRIHPDDKITERNVRSLKDAQISLFDQV